MRATLHRPPPLLARWRLETLARLLPALAAGTLAGWQAVSRPLWLDEIFTARWMALSPGALLRALGDDLHPPLYFLLLKLFTAIAGVSELSLRLPSIACATLAPLIWEWAFVGEHGRTPGVSARVGAPQLPGAARWVAWLIALSPLIALHAGMARYYSLALLLAGITHGAFLRSLERGGERWVIYAAAWTLLLYTSYTAALLGIAHGIFVLLTRRSALRGWGAAALATSVAFMPWLPTLIRQLFAAHTVPPALEGHGAFGPLLKLCYLFYTAIAGETLYPWRPQAWLALLTAASLTGIGILYGWLRTVSARVLLLTLVLEIVLLGTLAPGTGFAQWPARLLFLTPFLLLAIAWGLGSVRVRPALLASLGLFLPWLMAHSNRLAERDYLNPVLITPATWMVDTVKTHFEPGDLIVSEGDSGFDWYWSRRGVRGILPCPPSAADSLAAAADPPPRVWTVRLGRDKTEAPASDAVFLRLFGRYGENKPWLFLPADWEYLKWKRALIGHEPYHFRAVVTLLRLPQPLPAGPSERRRKTR